MTHLAASAVPSRCAVLLMPEHRGCSRLSMSRLELRLTLLRAPGMAQQPRSLFVQPACRSSRPISDRGVL